MPAHDDQEPRRATGEPGQEDKEASEETDEGTPKAEGIKAWGEGLLGHPRRRRPIVCPNVCCVNYDRWVFDQVKPVMDDDWKWVMGWYRCIRCDTIFEHQWRGYDTITDRQERI